MLFEGRERGHPSLPWSFQTVAKYLLQKYEGDSNGDRVQCDARGAYRLLLHYPLRDLQRWFHQMVLHRLSYLRRK